MNHSLRQPWGDERPSSARGFLGPLEEDVMDVVWRLGAGNVRDVVRHMQRNLSYTTIITTLDRLYKKGLLDRELTDRAFVYSAKVTREEWDRRRGGARKGGFLHGEEGGHDRR